MHANRRAKKTSRARRAVSIAVCFTRNWQSARAGGPLRDAPLIPPPCPFPPVSPVAVCTMPYMSLTAAEHGGEARGRLIDASELVGAAGGANAALVTAAAADVADDGGGALRRVLLSAALQEAALASSPGSSPDIGDGGGPVRRCSVLTQFCRRC